MDHWPPGEHASHGAPLTDENSYFSPQVFAYVALAAASFLIVLRVYAKSANMDTAK